MKKVSSLVIGLIAIITLSSFVIFRFYTLSYSLKFGSWYGSVVFVFFWIAEMFILLHALGYFFNIINASFNYNRRYVRYAGRKHANVTIIVPVKDEPLDVVTRTIVACKNLDYDNYTIVILDSSEKEEDIQKFKRLCEKEKIEYYKNRKHSRGAKAGAINHILPHIESPYIAIFDSDYRPTRNFLKLLIPQMEENPKLAFIQTPQFYGTLGNSLVSRAAQVQQSIFYEYICEGKSVNGGMFMCGTNMVVRVAALRQIGGFDEHSITEDFATSIRFHTAGWQSNYYNFTTAFGDGPLNITQYLRQQYRWAYGTLDVFFRYMGRITLSPSFSLSQKVEYFLAGSYYMIGIMWMILVIVPILYIFFRIPPYLSQVEFYLFVYLPYFAFSLLLFFQSFIHRRYHVKEWFLAQSLAFIAVPVYIKAFFNALLRKRADFELTKKHVGIDSVDWSHLQVQFIMLFLLFISIIAGFLQMVFYGFDSALMVNIFWCVFHFFIMGYLLVLLYVEKRSARSARFRGAFS